MNYYISDLHIGHQNILKYDNRPFLTMEEMTEKIISNWNNTVKDTDCVYLLGDIAWKNNLAIETVKRLNGRKFLILGNHDHPSKELYSLFEWVKDYAKIVDHDRQIILSHYPMIRWDKSHHGTIHLYGHVHAGIGYEEVLRINKMFAEQGKTHNCYNVGCMLYYMNYTPRTLMEIIESCHGLRIPKFYEDEPLPFGFFTAPNPYAENNFRFDYRKLIDYANTINKSIYDMTKEEILESGCGITFSH